uniref:Uncharacterized protein n=1 Tax=Amphimedon queenslandica TaxID=400682 RepID=A0A1X7VTU1_AMPQE
MPETALKCSTCATALKNGLVNSYGEEILQQGWNIIMEEDSLYNYSNNAAQAIEGGPSDPEVDDGAASDATALSPVPLGGGTEPDDFIE